MSATAPSGRPRVARRALDSARSAPPGGWTRRRIAAVLAGSTAYTRRVAALMLIESLSAREAGVVLGAPAHEVERAYRSLLAELTHALRAARLRPAGRGAARARLVEVPVSLRRAS